MMTRRSLLHGAAALGATLATPLLPAAPPARRIVDCHTHFYDPTRPQGVPWPGKNTPLHRRVLPDDWMAVAGPLGVTETIVVEASAWLEDNQWLLDLADQDRRLLGIIGHLEPGTPEFAAHVKRFAAHPLYRGIRVSSKEAAAPADPAAYEAGLKALAEANLVLDINGGPATPGIAARWAERFPDLTIIINHCGNPGDPAKPLAEEWKAGVNAAGKCPRVFCKVSALVEGVKETPGNAPADPAYYLPILDPLWEAFGPERLIYGSNWPVSDRGAPYATVFKIVEAYFGGKGGEVPERYFWKNSRTAYGWKDRV